MALRLSTALRNFLLETGPFEAAFAGGTCKVFTGSQPASADDAEVGTPVVLFTDNQGAHTAEVCATGGFSVVGTVGQVDTVTVNSIEIMGSATLFATTLTALAAAVAAKINANPKNKQYRATSNVALVTITAIPGQGTAANLTLASTGSGGITFSGTTGLASGVNSVNGLKFGVSTDGVLVKDPLQTWSGVGLATATAGWFRLLGAVADGGGSDASNKVLLRLDGNVGSSGANMNLTSTAIVISAVQTLPTFSLGEPAA